MSFEQYGIIVSGTGQVRSTCPQCSPGRKKKNDTCLSVNINEGVWFCNHCGWAGSIHESQYKTFEYEAKPSLPAKIIDWFEARGISRGIVEQEKIDYVNGAIRFPYFYNSVCVNSKYRTLDKKFWQEKDPKKCFYRRDRAILSEKSTLVITEGCMDALACVMAGIEAVSIPDGAPNPDAKSYASKFNFMENEEKLFDKFTKIVIAGDNDPPGHALIRELGRRIGVERCFVPKYPEGCKDSNEVLVKFGKDKLRQIMSDASPFPVEGLVNPESCRRDLFNDYEFGVERGISTGWGNVDDLYTVRGGEMTIVTGIPGSGKSNIIDALCVNLMTNEGWKIGMFSPENLPIKRHMKTLSEKVVEKPFDDNRFAPRMSKAELSEAVSFIDEHVRFIIPEEGLVTVDSILKLARVLCLQYGISGLVIDPWNEIEHDQKSNEREDQYISRQLTKIRRFARFNGLHIWVIAHPTKMQKNADGKYDVPTLYDISGGAHWRNKADNGLCVYRDFDKNTTELHVQKIRFREIGTIGKTELKFKVSGNYKQC